MRSCASPFERREGGRDRGDADDPPLGGDQVAQMEIEVQTTTENKADLTTRLKELKGSTARQRSELVRPPSPVPLPPSRA